MTDDDGGSADNLGQVLRRYRTLAGMTQEMLANASGVARGRSATWSEAGSAGRSGRRSG